MNKVLCVHTNVEQCLYQFLRDGKCYHGKDPNECKTFKTQADGIDLGQLTSELKDRLGGSVVLKYRGLIEQNKTLWGDQEFVRPLGWPEPRVQVSEEGIVTYLWFDQKYWFVADIRTFERAYYSVPIFYERIKDSKCV